MSEKKKFQEQLASTETLIMQMSVFEDLKEECDFSRYNIQIISDHQEAVVKLQKLTDKGIKAIYLVNEEGLKDIDDFGLEEITVDD